MGWLHSSSSENHYYLSLLIIFLPWTSAFQYYPLSFLYAFNCACVSWFVYFFIILLNINLREFFYLQDLTSSLRFPTWNHKLILCLDFKMFAEWLPYPICTSDSMCLKSDLPAKPGPLWKLSVLVHGLLSITESSQMLTFHFPFFFFFFFLFASTSHYQQNLFLSLKSLKSHF